VNACAKVTTPAASDGKAQMRTFKFHWTIGILNLMFTCIATEAVRLIKQAQSVRQGPPHALMFLSRAVKGTKLKTEAMEWGNLHPPSSRAQIGDPLKTSNC
jgi:hypothetical protein